QLSSVLAGGLSPIIATTLLEYGYGRGAISLYLIGMAVITIIALGAATETVRHDIEHAGRG
ncbi:MAG TPA: MFS transporter, partial [Terriglobia bacterium]|nr:MFS transporter [Terriglobia bacterium]